MKIYDFNTEAYFEVWTESQELAAATLLKEVQRIADALMVDISLEVQEQAALDDEGNIGLPLLKPELSFEWITKSLLEIERTIEMYASRRTSDVWLLQCRRELACRLFTRPEAIPEETRILRMSQLISAIALFAAPGNTVLPDQSVKMYENPVSKELAIDIHVLWELCDLHEYAQTQRRRLLLGGIPFLSDLPFPEIKLPPHLEKIIEGRNRTPEMVSAFSRIGLHLSPSQDFFDFAKKNPWSIVCVAGPVRDDVLAQQSYETASDVRPFGMDFQDIRPILETLQMFDQAIREQWSMSAIEIVAAVQVAYSFILSALANPETHQQTLYVLETRAVFSTEESALLTSLHNKISEVAQKLGSSIPSERVPSVVAHFMERFVSHPSTFQATQDDMIRLHAPFPFLFRAGNKILLDASVVLRAFSSIVNFLDLKNQQLSDKGKRFENQVRSLLVSSDLGLRTVPDMERRFFEDGREVGEADVVVQIADTAFLIECKSHRYRGINDCITWRQALNRVRAFGDWARQTHRTAQYLAEHPQGAKHRIPEDIRWIVPILCTPVVEVIPSDDNALYLVKDELLITMTPAELLNFIHSRRWESERERVVQYPVRHPYALLIVGHFFTGLRQFPEAIKTYQEALAAHPTSIEALISLGDVYLETRQVEEAIEAYRRALKQAPDEPAVLRKLGVALFHTEGLDEAISVYQQALEIEPHNPDTMIFLANAFDAKGEIDLAIRMYRRALRISPKNPHAHYNLAIALTRKGRVCRAISAYRKAIKLLPGYFEAHMNLAVLLMKQGRHRKAIESLLQARSIHPDSIPALSLLAQALEEAGYLAGALLYRAQIAIERKDLEEALGLLQEALALEPELPMAHALMGSLQVARARPDLAATAFQKTSSLRPRTFGSRLNLGLALGESGQLDDAFRALREARALLPGDKEPLHELGGAFNNLGIFFANEGRDEEAIAAFKESIDLVPDYPIGQFNLANALLRNGRLDEAITHYRTTVDLDPNHYQAFSNLGAALRQKGRFADATEATRKALALQPDDVISIGSLAGLYHLQGWLTQALPVYQRFLARVDEDPGAHPYPDGILAQYATLLRTMGYETEAERLEARLSEHERVDESAPEDQDI